MTRLRCSYGVSYSGHGFSPPAERRVPFIEAIHNPPICHGMPMETIGAQRTRRITERIVQRGLPLGRCRIDYGLEGYLACPVHNWYRGDHDRDLLRDGRCPHAPIAAWIERRHAA